MSIKARRIAEGLRARAKNLRLGHEGKSDPLSEEYCIFANELDEAAELIERYDSQE